MPGHENTHYKAQQTFEDEPLFTKYSRNKNHAVQFDDEHESKVSVSGKQYSAPKTKKEQR